MKSINSTTTGLSNTIGGEWRHLILLMIACAMTFHVGASTPIDSGFRLDVEALNRKTTELEKLLREQPEASADVVEAGNAHAEAVKASREAHERARANPGNEAAKQTAQATNKEKFAAFRRQLLAEGKDIEAEGLRVKQAIELIEQLESMSAVFKSRMARNGATPEALEALQRAQRAQAGAHARAVQRINAIDPARARRLQGILLMSARQGALPMKRADALMKALDRQVDNTATVKDGLFGYYQTLVAQKEALRALAGLGQIREVVDSLGAASPDPIVVIQSLDARSEQRWNRIDTLAEDVIGDESDYELTPSTWGNDRLEEMKKW